MNRAMTLFPRRAARMALAGATLFFGATPSFSAEETTRVLVRRLGDALPDLVLNDGITSATLGSAYRLLEDFNVVKLPVFVLLILFVIFFYILNNRVRKGGEVELRRLPGINAIEEAIGRATEMGRPVLFIPGINDIDDIQTLAGINILAHVAYIAAEYDTPVIVATRRSVVLTICEEVVKAASLAAGRPENYIPNNMRYLSDEQFAFTAGVNGIMMRERPASCIYQGCFYSESLILAETGYVSGAIQVAGTANVSQLPFFVAACDYTLIGEEFYAASAYLSKEPPVLASVKAADWLKLVIMPVIVLGVVAITIAVMLPEGSDLSVKVHKFVLLLKEII